MTVANVGRRRYIWERRWLPPAGILDERPNLNGCLNGKLIRCRARQMWRSYKWRPAAFRHPTFATYRRREAARTPRWYFFSKISYARRHQRIDDDTIDACLLRLHAAIYQRDLHIVLIKLFGNTDAVVPFKCKFYVDVETCQITRKVK